MSVKPIPISKTKIIVPHRRPELLSRPRLLESLQALLDNKLLLLSAPAGYGKTSLMIDLAHHATMPVCWLSLDPLDRDPQRFLAYLIAALTERFPGVGETSRLQLNQIRSIETDAESILVMLTNELYDHVDSDFLLILDDYHLLDDAPIISSLLNRLLQLVDENCHVLLSSRTLPELDDVTLMVAREQVAGLSHAELEFLPREVQALYTQNYHQYLSEESASEIVQQTGGWITGMVLASLPGTTRISGVDTFAYLGRQVLDQQLVHVREFLMRTSMPDEFNAEFCEIVLGPLHSGAQNWLALMGLILEKNLFVLPVGADGRWLRYHPLFREFLQTRLKEERPDEVLQILKRMVTAYEKVGEWEKAYFTCKQLNDPEALAGVVEHSGTSMLQNALVTLENWINSLPPSVVRSRPGLISLRGPMLAMKGNLKESGQLLDTAVSIYKKKRDIGGLTMALTRRANTHRLLGDYHASLADTKEALRLAESNPVYQPLYAEALRIRGLDLYRLGESHQAIEALEHSLSLYKALNETVSIPTVLMEIGMVLHSAVGNIDAAKVSYQEALRIIQLQKNLYSEAEILNNLAVLYYQLGEYELSSETFEKGLECARKSRNQRAESLILTGLGDLYSEIDEFDAAMQAYEQAETIASGIPGSFILNYLVMAKGVLALLKKDLKTASEILTAHRRKLKSSQSTYERGLWGLFEGRFHLLKDEHRKAIRLLQECKNYFIQDGRDLEIQCSTIWLAAAYYQAGEKDNARTEMNVLTTRANPDHALLIAFRQANAWLNDLQNDAQIGKQLGGLFEKSRLLAMNLPSIRRTLRRHAQSIQIPAASLTIRAFGHADVNINGRSIAMSEWRTQSVRDLFFYFLYKDEAVTKEQISETLWPEVDEPQLLKARFKNEIYRLRRAIGRDVVIFDEEYYRFNRALDYTYDVEAFDSHLLRARKAIDKTERIVHLQKAVDIAQGSYLSDVDAAWAHIERERLGRAYVSALEELAKLYLDENRLEQCLSVCQLVLDRDQYNEKIYQIEMRVFAALGDRISIARQYQVCKTTLQEGLGLLPSQETEQIFRELTS